MNQGQQFLAHLQSVKDECISGWRVFARIDEFGALVITESKPWSSRLDRRADGGFSARELVPDYEPIKQFEVTDETFNESLF